MVDSIVVLHLETFDVLIEIFRSTTATACEQRAFVLRAVGIGSQVIATDDGFALCVESGAETIACDQLARYETENASPAKAPQMPTLHRGAWIAPLVYAVALIAMAYLAGKDAFGFDWYAAGALSNAVSDGNEWWRVITALALHVDHGHLLRNIGFGILFCYPAARLLGSGVALASMIFAAALGNFLDAVLMPQNHVSIGASTIVFAALGLISAYSWRLQFSPRLRWAHRWAPLVVGVALLGLIGSGGENTDVIAHITGFACGVVSGIILAHLPKPTLNNRTLQIVSGSAAIALFICAWVRAALSTHS